MSHVSKIAGLRGDVPQLSATAVNITITRSHPERPTSLPLHWPPGSFWMQLALFWK